MTELPPLGMFVRCAYDELPVVSLVISAQQKLIAFVDEHQRGDGECEAIKS